jgi:ABC-type multidrug transport system fused ATPase/permease subunit
MDLSQFNSFIEQARDKLLCDANCQKERQTQDLEAIYLQAQSNLYNAPSQLQEARKNYFISSKGEAVYEEMQEEILEKRISVLKEELETRNIEEVRQLKIDIDIYANLYTNYRNMVDLYVKYVTENAKYKKELTEKESEITTNDRKTYYENQGIETLQFIYSYFFLFIYGIFLVIYIFLAIFYIRNGSLLKRVALFVSFLFLPSLSVYIISSIMWIFHLLYSFLPKNVYWKP